ncbi:hypothetical protein A3I53_00760 [Candidatus Curtissbacteria bacterium RIFCSPLOWO2_02_FULL_40_13b]|uniref:Response regulatory domain-containing protein n=1 Tax=Candidatus Curtissbacteria bacterium RIFCSPLOWO2_02_FULL_40_13b TaxID=1797733 RepID=A0A1F5HQD2_9BACT|nr:MAG: hypothetical protein A3I53_00760 [Candidatus Curtissbacteria bacterium RIFCSPLOWO2_02_FULL_40_13b]
MVKTILLIEDDGILIDMYRKLLLNHGYNVNTAIDGEDGLKKALEDHPNLILLDIRIPKMDGMTVLKHLRADTWGKNAKVIILTNLDATDHILQGVVDDHPSYYMVKSNTRPEIVLEHIKEVIEE